MLGFSWPSRWAARRSGAASSRASAGCRDDARDVVEAAPAARSDAVPAPARPTGRPHPARAQPAAVLELAQDAIHRARVRTQVAVLKRAAQAVAVGATTRDQQQQPRREQLTRQLRVHQRVAARGVHAVRRILTSASRTGSCLARIIIERLLVGTPKRVVELPRRFEVGSEHVEALAAGVGDAMPNTSKMNTAPPPPDGSRNDHPRKSLDYIRRAFVSLHRA